MGSNVYDRRQCKSGGLGAVPPSRWAILPRVDNRSAPHLRLNRTLNVSDDIIESTEAGINVGAIYTDDAERPLFSKCDTEWRNWLTRSPFLDQVTVTGGWRHIRCPILEVALKFGDVLGRGFEFIYE